MIHYLRRSLCLLLATLSMGSSLQAQNISPAIQGQWDKAIVLYQSGDFVTSATEFKDLCLKQVGSACSNLGFQYEFGQGVEKDLAAARVFMERGCNLGDPQGCVGIGFIYSRGLGVTKDDVVAESDFKKACDLGASEGCHDLGLMLFGQKKFTEAAKIFDTGCKGKDAWDCAHLATLYLFGKGVPQDAKLAHSLGQTSCDSGISEGCMTLGRIYEIGVPPFSSDNTLAASYFEKARALEPTPSQLREIDMALSRLKASR